MKSHDYKLIVSFLSNVAFSKLLTLHTLSLVNHKSICFEKTTSKITSYGKLIYSNIIFLNFLFRYVGVCCGIKVLSVLTFLLDWYLIKRRETSEKKQTALTVGEVVNSIISLDKRMHLLNLSLQFIWCCYPKFHESLTLFLMGPGLTLPHGGDIMHLAFGLETAKN